MSALLTWPSPGSLCELRDTSQAPRVPTTIGRDECIDLGLVGGQALISVHRDSPEDVGFREIFVSIDGESVGILRHGDRLSHELNPGPHVVRAHNTLFWRTHHLVLKPGEHVRFTAINRAGFGTFGLLFFLGAMPVYLTFERATVSQDTRSRA